MRSLQGSKSHKRQKLKSASATLRGFLRCWVKTKCSYLLGHLEEDLKWFRKGRVNRDTFLMTFPIHEGWTWTIGGQAVATRREAPTAAMRLTLLLIYIQRASGARVILAIYSKRRPLIVWENRRVLLAKHSQNWTFWGGRGGGGPLISMSF